MLISLVLLSGDGTAASIPEGAPGRPFSMVEPSPLELLPCSFRATTAIRSSDRADTSVLVIVAGGLETPLAPEISQLASDLAAEGCNVTVSIMDGGTAGDLRSFLQSNPGYSGAILVGDLPRAWFESDGWGAHEEFPFDLYLMDLDGAWTDSDGDGLYDGHAGDKAPEIWVGRIDAHAMEFGSELSLLRDYFAANHAYRTGSLSVPARALAFNDDDWNSYGGSGLESIYSTVDVVNTDAQTTASNYRSRLAMGYEFIHLMAHSSPWGHTFKIPGGYGGTVMTPEISEINPQTVFVQLFACSNCRWTEPNCLGNWYLFGTDYGLLAIGSTKTGSLLEFEEFYEPIGAGSTPGEAFRQWFTTVGIYDIDWHYGCVLLGDPTIMPLSGRGLLTAALPGHGSAGGGDAYFQVSTSVHSDCHPSVASSGGSVWIAWLSGQNGRLDIAAREFSGDSWSSVYYVDPDEYWDVTPSLAVDGSGEPWLAWADFDESTYGYRIKIAGGFAFGTVSVAADGSGYDVDPCLAFADGRMWLAWQTWRRGGGDIMVKALDGSVPEAFVSADGTCDISPTAAADQSEALHMAWSEGSTDGSRILWTRGGAGGFSTPVEVSSGDFCRAPSLSRAGDALFLLWQEDDGPSRILVRTWTGTAWGPETELYASDTDPAFAPTAGLSTSGQPCAAWQVGNGIDAQIWQSTLTGSGWSVPGLLVDPAGPAWLPALTDGVIAWSGTGGGTNWDIFASLDGGVGIGQGGDIPQSVRLSLLGNPISSMLSIGVPVDLVGSPEVMVRVYDLSGRSVIETTGILRAGSSFDIPCGGLTPGVYAIRVSGPMQPWSSLFTILR
jgi:hypothetical protein